MMPSIGNTFSNQNKKREEKKKKERSCLKE
jgi:hypothetical protein